MGDRTRLIGLSDHFLLHPGRLCPGAPLSSMDEQTAVDTALWRQTLSRLRRELAELPTAQRDWLAQQITLIGQLQEQLDRVFVAVDGPQICRDCLGGCCSRAKHHLTLGNVLAYLLAGEEPPTPDFTRPCPLLGPAGCQLPVTRRPFNCIIFLCDAVDQALSIEQRQAFARIESELRQVYHAIAERCPGASLRGLLIAAERVGARSLLTKGELGKESS